MSRNAWVPGVSSHGGEGGSTWVFSVFPHELWAAEGSWTAVLYHIWRMSKTCPTSSSHQKGSPQLAGLGELLHSKTDQPFHFPPMLLGVSSPAMWPREGPVPRCCEVQPSVQQQGQSLWALLTRGNAIAEPYSLHKFLILEGGYSCVGFCFTGQLIFCHVDFGK